jgi:hypothetical protein
LANFAQALPVALYKYTRKIIILPACILNTPLNTTDFWRYIPNLVPVTFLLGKKVLIRAGQVAHKKLIA